MEPTLGEIRLFAGNFAPRGWALCEGQLLPINQNQALYSILGTTYGGDGRTSFALPDLRGRGPIHPGHGPGLSEYRLGAKGGVETVTLDQTQLPGHTHSAQPELNFAAPAGTVATTPTPGPAAHFGPGVGPLYANGAADTTLGSGDVQGTVRPLNVGGGQAHENRQPWIAINAIIAIAGLFPSRN